MKAKRLLVRGIVQGVGFRFFAERTARHLGLSGYVRNLIDGRVEVLAAGPDETVDAFVAQIRQGPAAGRVDEVEVTDTILEEGMRRFEIRH